MSDAHHAQLDFIALAKAIERANTLSAEAIAVLHKVSEAWREVEDLSPPVLARRPRQLAQLFGEQQARFQAILVSTMADPAAPNDTRRAAIRSKRPT